MNTEIKNVRPVISDGQYSIGYDADDRAGQWDGNMTETCTEFRVAKEGDEFSDGSESWRVEDGGWICQE